MKDSSSRCRRTSDPAGDRLPLGVDRREFLRALGAASIAAGAASGCTVPVRTIRLADAAAFEISIARFPELANPGGRVRAIHPSAGAIYVIRSAEGALALSAICTHQSCDVAPSGAGFRCPCHGSRFDADGSRRSGPARRALERFDAEIEGDRIVVRVETSPNSNPSKGS